MDQYQFKHLSVGTLLRHINSRTQKSVGKKIGSGTCKRISVNSPCWETSDSCMDKSLENGSCSLGEGVNSQTQPPANVQITKIIKVSRRTKHCS